jgi:hypothetical protein
MQNSFPSESASTTHGCSRCPTSILLAPNPQATINFSLLVTVHPGGVRDDPGRSEWTESDLSTPDDRAFQAAADR